MEGFREFQGQTLDECITQAMEWFDCGRENLEVDILQDAKSGIFGIVGARKAKIRARRARMPEAVKSMIGHHEKKAAAPAEHPEDAAANKKIVQPADRERASHPDRESKAAGPRQHKEAKSPDTVQHREPKEAGAGQHKESKAPAAVQRRESKAPGAVHHNDSPDRKQDGALPPSPDRSGTEKAASSPVDYNDGDDLPDAPLAELDKEKLHSALQEIVSRLVRPVAGREVAMSIDLSRDRPRVRIEWEGDAGLLIGREGQTLVAFQYLASRMLSRVMGTVLHVQLDIGEYHTRQDAKLCELAKALAEKARKTGRPYSTRPLSSYHRRIIHLCLRAEEGVQTRSTGEGTLKRVLISPRRQ